ncbi:MAG TPA: PP2C family protein-serine/threonine phosphatase [Candidatus Babeliales bacterium]|jgi:protein phosphatase 1L|nr:PP2C family protein-serine/threonine phosphatase [Candidatus Babeliales bacterium]
MLHLFYDKGIAVDKKLTLLLACSVVGFCYASEKQMLVGVSSEINARKYQEDRFFHGNVDGGQWYGVYDGHGHKDGHVISEFLANNLHNYFSKASGCIRDKMFSAFKDADNDVFMKLHPECGSTASVVFIKDDIAHFAHVGDSRAVLECNGKVAFATADHKPNRPDEYVRIEDAGGVVWNGRVCGCLGVSRVFGDYDCDMQKHIIIAKPEYTALPLTGDDRFLVLASDGLWDKIKNKEVATILNTSSIQSMSELAKLLLFLAIRRGSLDNITVMVIDLLS